MSESVTYSVDSLTISVSDILRGLKLLLVFFSVVFLVVVCSLLSLMIGCELLFDSTLQESLESSLAMFSL